MLHWVKWSYKIYQKKMNNNKITIVTPAYNNLPYIKKTIDSVINQSFKNWEMIISDDGSTDGTSEFLKKIKNKKIKIFFHKHNLGIFKNLKFLNFKARTSIIKILCADDYLPKNSLKNISLFMQKNKSCCLLTCFDQLSRKQPSLKILSKIGSKSYLRFKPKSAMIAFFAFGNICGNLTRVTYRKSINNKNPVFNQKYHYTGDYNAWVRISNECGFYLLKKNLVYVRRHANQASHKLNKKNDLYPQLSEIYKFLLKNISKNHYPYLRKYLLITVLPSRLSNYTKCLISGELKLAKKVFLNLPLNISILECFIYSIFYLLKKNFLETYYKNYIISIISDQNRS
jgi:glycosyltransferase involved in cell wall biosynthesis